MAENSKIVDFSDALGERYLAYALSTITSRSLPDVRDGLKPVHRRLLWAMLQLKLDPKSGFKKCARVVGDVIGKYHPHGDTAVYDTMVRLAQEFSVRYPLVEGQGNFGSVDGDNAAAMRYTEARMTAVAIALLKDIDKDTVDFRDTYDNQDIEPVILPSCFPNLLANGSEGIAVGMATSIPPHNVGELCDALLYLIKTPNPSIEKLTSFVQAPDFPTGGIIVESRKNIINNYSTGKGAFRMRAKWEKEELERGAYNIVVTEIPYQVNKSRLIEKIATLFKDKKLALLGNVMDESAENIRIVFEPKNRSVDPEILMESLFKLTDLESRFNMNMNVLTASGTPKVLNLREVLQAFLDHRHDVLVRRSKYRIGKIDHRLEILSGLMVVYLNLDEVIRIIRQEDEPKQVMIAKWQLSDVQVEAILNTRLRSLRKLEEMAIRTEISDLEAEKSLLIELLNSQELRWQHIAAEIKDIKKQFGQNTDLGKRRTIVGDAPKDVVVSIEAFVEREPITIICSKLGWIRALKGHNNNIETIKYKEGDQQRFIIKAHTTDKLFLFASNGRFYTLGCDKFAGGKSNGDAIRLMADIEQEHDINNMFIYQKEQKILVASKAGKGFVAISDDLVAMTKNGKQVLNIPEKVKGLSKNFAHICVLVKENDDMVAVIGENRKLLIFPISDLPEMKRGQGVQMQRYKGGGLSDAITINSTDGLSWQTGERTRSENDLTEWLGSKAHTGRVPPRGFPRNNRFV